MCDVWRSVNGECSLSRGSPAIKLATRASMPTSRALGTDNMWYHLALLGLAQSKPSLSAQTCTRQAQAELDGSTCAVYPVPKGMYLPPPLSRAMAHLLRSRSFLRSSEKAKQPRRAGCANRSSLTDYTVHE